MIHFSLTLDQFKLADPTDSQWKIENRWFVNQEGLSVNITTRER
jgi:hypothetical protein